MTCAHVRAAHVALGLVAVRVRAGANGRIGPGDDVARHRAGADAGGAGAAAAVAGLPADVSGDATAARRLTHAARAGNDGAHPAAARRAVARAGLAVDR